MSVEKSKGKEKTKAESVNELQDGGKITVRTVEEQKYVNMLLDILRGVNEQDKKALMMTIASFHPFCNKERAWEEPKKQQVRKTLKERMDEFDSDAIDTLEYGFYYVNGVLATTQRISQENGEGETEEMPADFYWIVDEARERLDKIRTLLGFIIETDDSKENSAGLQG